MEAGHCGETTTIHEGEEGGGVENNGQSAQVISRMSRKKVPFSLWFNLLSWLFCNPE
jgi:hypothetical protein